MRLKRLLPYQCSASECRNRKKHVRPKRKGGPTCIKKKQSLQEDSVAARDGGGQARKKDGEGDEGGRRGRHSAVRRTHADQGDTGAGKKVWGPTRQREKTVDSSSPSLENLSGVYKYASGKRRRSNSVKKRTPQKNWGEEILRKRRKAPKHSVYRRGRRGLLSQLHGNEKRKGRKPKGDRGIRNASSTHLSPLGSNREGLARL